MLWVEIWEKSLSLLLNMLFDCSCGSWGNQAMLRISHLRIHSVITENALCELNSVKLLSCTTNRPGYSLTRKKMVLRFLSSHQMFLSQANKCMHKLILESYSEKRSIRTCFHRRQMNPLIKRIRLSFNRLENIELSESSIYWTHTINTHTHTFRFILLSNKIWYFLWKLFSCWFFFFSTQQFISKLYLEALSHWK